MKSVCCSGVVAGPQTILLQSERHLDALLVMGLEHRREGIVDRVKENHSGHNGAHRHKQRLALASQTQQQAVKACCRKHGQQIISARDVESEQMKQPTDKRRAGKKQRHVARSGYLPAINREHADQKQSKQHYHDGFSERHPHEHRFGILHGHHKYDHGSRSGKKHQPAHSLAVEHEE